MENERPPVSYFKRGNKDGKENERPPVPYKKDEIFDRPPVASGKKETRDNFASDEFDTLMEHRRELEDEKLTNKKRTNVQMREERNSKNEYRPPHMGKRKYVKDFASEMERELEVRKQDNNINPPPPHKRYFNNENDEHNGLDEQDDIIDNRAEENDFIKENNGDSKNVNIDTITTKKSSDKKVKRVKRPSQPWIKLLRPQHELVYKKVADKEKNIPYYPWKRRVHIVKDLKRN